MERLPAANGFRTFFIRFQLVGQVAPQALPDNPDFMQVEKRQKPVMKFSVLTPSPQQSNQLAGIRVGGVGEGLNWWSQIIRLDCHCCPKNWTAKIILRPLFLFFYFMSIGWLGPIPNHYNAIFDPENCNIASK